MQERQARRLNVIFHNIEELDTNLKQDLEKNDIKIVKDILNEIGIKTEKDDIVDPIRFDKKKENKKPRLLRITMKNISKKISIFKNINKIKNNGNYKNIIVQTDMTKREREEENQLLEEAKKLNKDLKPGDPRYKIRGPPGNRQLKG